jgi:DNA polymerase/3'-5' exonuclease PolX
MTKQSTLFQTTEPTVLAELDLEEADKLAKAIKAAVEAHCSQIEVAGSIRRQKPKVHDIDFVVVAKNDSDWKAINEVLRRLKAKPNCSGLLRKPAHKSIRSLPKRTLPS